MASDFCVWREHLSELRCTFLDDGDVLVFGKENERCGATDNYDNTTQEKISSEVKAMNSKGV